MLLHESFGQCPLQQARREMPWHPDHGEWWRRDNRPSVTYQRAAIAEAGTEGRLTLNASIDGMLSERRRDGFCWPASVAMANGEDRFRIVPFSQRKATDKATDNEIAAFLAKRRDVQPIKARLARGRLRAMVRRLG